MMEMQGQLDIFSMIEPQEEEPQMLPGRGQEVYLVRKAEVIKCTDSDIGGSWVCREGSRSCIFADYGSARRKADEYLETHDGIILAEDIKPASVAAFSYIRDCDNRKMTAFYCDLGNDMYYIKEFMTFHHICKGKKAVGRFMKQQEFQYNSPKRIDGYVPKFKNMYRCTEQSDWDYAECEYVYAVG